MATFIVLALVLGYCAFLLYKGYKDRKEGRHTGCAGCSGCGSGSCSACGSGSAPEKWFDRKRG
ncbi:MAG: FeoB-associated Cys-rich membrane protein [Eubacteriales bacterium]|nr:FeoB-associated Cys-rich membrane protein [Eubacteriales bacterium]